MKAPSVLLVFALDTCQASVNWSVAFWAPVYLTRYGIAPDAESAALATSNIILNSMIAVLSLLIGAISDATELRWAFAGAVLLMFSLGILVCLALLRTVRRDMARQQALVRSRTSAR